MGCRIAGVENSYKIMASEMDGATLKLYTLAEVAGRLMKKKIRRRTCGALRSRTYLVI